MKKVNLYILMTLMLGVCALPLGAVSNDYSTNDQTRSHSSLDEEDEEDDEDDEEEDEYDILDRNEIDDTDTFAIPFDDSEVEDEEEINRAEKKEVFHLPHSRSK